MDKKNSPKGIKAPSFTWGGTNPLWANQAKIRADQMEEKDLEKENKKNKHQHYYLRDYN